MNALRHSRQRVGATGHICPGRPNGEVKGVAATGDAHVEFTGSQLLDVLRRQPQYHFGVRILQGLFLVEDDRARERLGQPVLLGRGDDLACDDAQRDAVGVAAAERLLGVVVGDVADAALEGQGLLDLAGLAAACECPPARRCGRRGYSASR
ncbi:hypothetical protein [Streptomyces nigra]|uniref:hypothetical protein n=1 Tax=Streptomyces nigra TaxID=1827580 RepID=UPI003647C7AC